MDDGGKPDVHLELNLQVSDAACEYSVSTDSDIKQDRMSSTVSTDCEESADIPEHCMFDYNILHGIKCEHERPEEMQTDNAYGRQGDHIQGHVVQCLQTVKLEENGQKFREQRRVLPFNSTDRESNSMCDANETIQLKPEQKEDPDEYDTNNEAPRQWVVSPDGVLKEVKAEHTSDASDMLSVGDCSKNVGHKQRTQTVSYDNNIHTNVKVSTCDVSSSQFRSHGNDLKAHRRTGSMVKHFTCDTCGKQFEYLCRLKMHEKIHTNVKTFACDTCGKSSNTSGNLKQHEMIHTGAKPFTCDTCGNSFARSGTLKMHELIHTGGKYFACDTCGKSFARLGDVKSHERTHTGVKPFACDTCGKSFAQSGALKTHEMTHTGVKPFACDTCGSKFARSGNLKMHELIHTGGKYFACDTCGKSFARPGDVKRHEMTHRPTGGKPFACEKCGKTFTLSGDVKRHEMEVECWT